MSRFWQRCRAYIGCWCNCIGIAWVSYFVSIWEVLAILFAILQAACQQTTAYSRADVVLLNKCGQTVFPPSFTNAERVRLETEAFVTGERARFGFDALISGTALSVLGDLKPRHDCDTSTVSNIRRRTRDRQSTS